MSETQIHPPVPLSGTFVSLISTMDHGQVAADIDDALRAATQAAEETGAKAKVTLELTIIPNGVGAGDTPLFKVEAKPKITLPQKARTPQNFFKDDDGNLTRRNPRQEEMKLTAMEGGAKKAEPAAPAVTGSK